MRRSDKRSRVSKLQTPIPEKDIENLMIGDQIDIRGMIYCGRDAVLPKLASLIKNNDLNSLEVNLRGAVIFHTAISPAGMGPTSSNKVEIEGTMPELSKAGVKIHLGKGALSPETTEELKKYHSLFAITPPVTALFMERMVSKRLVAFKEEGMEALYEVEVSGFPAIIAIAHGESIFSNTRRN